MLLRLFSLGLVLGVVALVVIFNRQIMDFSAGYLAHKQAQSAVKSHNWEKAIGIYEEALQSNPSNVKVALHLAAYYQQDEQDGKAKQIYENILEQKPDAVSVRIAYADMLAEKPEGLNPAILQYRQALKSAPSNPLLLNRLGQLYRKAASEPTEKREAVQAWLLDWAIYYYRLSLKVNPAMYNSRFGVGVAYQMRDKPEQAANQYCNALLIRPEAYEARFNLGLSLVDLKYADLGFRQMNRAVRMLSDADNAPLAQALAEQIYTVRSAIYYDSDYAGLGKSGALPAFLKAACVADAPEKTADAE